MGIIERDETEGSSVVLATDQQNHGGGIGHQGHRANLSAVAPGPWAPEDEPLKEGRP